MRSRKRRTSVTMLVFGVLALAAASPALGVTIGSNLSVAVNAGVCPLSGSGETSCSYVQEGLADDHTALGGVQPRGRFGVITRWKVSTGPATPATAGVKVRLRIIQAGGVSYAYGASPYEELPLGEPGIHVFPARLSIDEAKQYVGIDTIVTGSGGGEAAAPFAYRASGAGTVWKWIPGLSEGVLPQSDAEGDLELLFNADIEPDRDHDGYGDKTQDACPEDPRRQADCDRTPPRTYLTYPQRQDFLAKKKAVVWLRSNENGRAYASGQIEIRGGAIWGIYSDSGPIRRGEKRKLVLRIPGKARAAAAQAFANGRRVVLKVTASADDGAGNRSGATVATIRPQA
ncbi:MAG TPA: hypothetical protein VF504_05125 [Solirubrobacterales bacterium]|jgi:hypothetical protein